MLREILKRSLLIGLVITFLSSICNGQSEIHPLKVGDKVPDLLFEKVFNHNFRSAKLSDFKSKLIVLDIWNRHCSSCIESFPKLQTLSKRYSPDLNVILITTDNEADFLKLKNRSPTVNNTILPVITDAWYIKKLFPTQFVPLQIWLDSTLTVLAITPGYNTNNESIEFYLKKNIVSSVVRYGSYNDFNPQTSLLEEGEGRMRSRISQYSMLFKAINKIQRNSIRLTQNQDGKVDGMQVINFGILQLYEQVYPKYIGRIISYLSDSYLDSIGLTRDSLYDNKRVFCYEVKLPANLADSIGVLNEYLKEDLRRYFGVNPVVDTLDAKLLELVSLNKRFDSAIEDSLSSPVLSEVYNDTLFLEKATVGLLLNNIEKMLRESSDSIPFILESKLKMHSLISVSISLKNTSIDKINENLRRADLQIIERGSKPSEYLFLMPGR